MTNTWGKFVVAVTLCIGSVSVSEARDIKVTISRRSSTTPVQRLNREGVEAVQKNHFDKAKELFYKAYLMDPGDPFTLNNLGYIAELEGQQERAQTFYGLASGQATEAFIDRASSASLKGQPLEEAISAVHDIPVQINRANVEAVRLLSQDRAWQADLLLQRTLALDPKNGFTLNNMGVAKEAEGEFDDAMKYYTAAADAHAPDTVVVTMDTAWRGKPVSEMAAESAKRLRARMKHLQSTETQTALFNMRGVSAMNRNDWRKAWENFSQAYKLNPRNAFSINNQGFMSELNGDLETAQDFYREAQTAPGSRGRVGLATRQNLEGTRLESVASGSETNVSGAIEAASQTRRSNNPAPVLLKHRDGTPVLEPAPQTAPSSRP